MQNTVLQRIELIVSFLGVSVRKFSKEIGVPQTTMSNLFNRGNEPNVTIVSSILERYKEVNPNWLISGEGDMLRSAIPIGAGINIGGGNKIKTNIGQIGNNVNIGDNNVTNTGTSGIAIGVGGDNSGKISINEVTGRETKCPEKELEEKPSKNGIPFYESLPASAGHLDVIIQDAHPTGWINIPGVTAKALFPVVGCSMKPEINPGDVIGITQIDIWETVDPDKTYLIITNEDRMIKHLAIDEVDDSILWCISPNYPKFKISKEDIKFIYRVSFCGKLM